MNRFVKIFTGLILVSAPAFADTLPVAVSKAYVDSGFAQKASAAIVSALADNLSTNNTIAKANSALQSGANVSVMTNDAGYITAAALSGYIPTSQKAAANGVASLDAGTKVPIAQLPTGVASTNVAIGNDERFDTIASGGMPSGSLGAGRAFIWIQ